MTGYPKEIEMVRSIGSRHEAIMVYSAADEERLAGMGYREVQRKIGDTLTVRKPPRFTPQVVANAIRAINDMPRHFAAPLRPPLACTLDGFAAREVPAGETLQPGDRITIAGVNPIHPRRRELDSPREPEPEFLPMYKMLP